MVQGEGEEELSRKYVHQCWYRIHETVFFVDNEIYNADLKR